MNLLDNFQRYIRRNELAAPEDFILLTVSGGVDSMVMLSLLSLIHISEPTRPY